MVAPSSSAQCVSSSLQSLLSEKVLWSPEGCTYVQNQTESPEAGATSSLFPSLHSSCHHTLSFWILCCIENFKNVTFQGVALTRNTSSKFSIFVDDISFQPKTATLQPFVFCMLSSQGKGWLAPVGFLQKKTVLWLLFSQDLGVVYKAECAFCTACLEQVLLQFSSGICDLLSIMVL